MLVGKQRRTWMPFLPLLLLMALLAACGGKDKATSPTGPSVDQPRPGETAATVTPSPMEGPSVTITFACSDHERIGPPELRPAGNKRSSRATDVDHFWPGSDVDNAIGFSGNSPA